MHHPNHFTYVDSHYVDNGINFQIGYQLVTQKNQYDYYYNKLVLGKVSNGIYNILNVHETMTNQLDIVCQE